MRQIKYIFIHHSQSPKEVTTLDDIYHWHVVQRGWSAVAYHQMIDGRGKIWQGRDDKTTGAHVKNINRESLGICLFGDFDKEKPNPEQIESLINCLKEKCKQYNIPKENILGHRDAGFVKESAKTSKKCPGENLYKMLPEIRERVFTEKVTPKVSIPPKTKCEKEDCSCGVKCADCKCEKTLEKKENKKEEYNIKNKKELNKNKKENKPKNKKDIFSVILEIINKLLKKG